MTYAVLVETLNPTHSRGVETETIFPATTVVTSDSVNTQKANFESRITVSVYHKTSNRSQVSNTSRVGIQLMSGAT